MKKTIWFIISFLSFHTTSFGQNTSVLNGFKYAVVLPLNYQDGSRDKYGIEIKAINALKKAGLIYINVDDVSNLPKDALSEPCLVANFIIENGNLPNAWNCGDIRLSIKNCKDEIIFNKIIDSDNAICNYPYSCCYDKWGDAVADYIRSMNYSYNPTVNTLKTIYPETEKTDESELSLKEYFDNNKIDELEGIYKSYQPELSYYKFAIKKFGDKYKAIIIESNYNHWKAGEVKATFEGSSIKGVYSVDWLMGNKTVTPTFAMLEGGGILTIDFNDKQTGKKTTDMFIKMYPTVENKTNYKNENSIKSTGSGFFLTTDGVIATNAHVIENAKNIEVIVLNDVGTFTYKTKVLLSDNNNDVALIKIDDETFKGVTTFPFSIKETAEIAEKVFTIGYPLNDIMGNNYKVSDGIISATSGISDDIRFYQISVPLQPGNSGGPLFNKEGNIIGITTARLNGQAIGTNVQNVNYAIKISYLLTLYKMLPNLGQLPNSSELSKKELQEQVKILKNYVCLVKVY